MIFISDKLSSAILILLSVFTMLLVLTWMAGPKTSSAIFITDDITQQKRDYSIDLKKALNNETIIPKLGLEGTLIFEDQKPHALLKVNNDQARWYALGDEVQTDLSITKIDSNSVLLKQGMAYYEVFLSNNNNEDSVDYSTHEDSQEPAILVEDENRIYLDDGQSISFGINTDELEPGIIELDSLISNELETEQTRSFGIETPIQDPVMDINEHVMTLAPR